MAFPESVKARAFMRSGGRCECERNTHSHSGRCATLLAVVTAQFHHKVPQDLGGADTIANCEVLCMRCRLETASYRAH